MGGCGSVPVMKTKIKTEKETPNMKSQHWKPKINPLNLKPQIKPQNFKPQIKPLNLKPQIKPQNFKPQIKPINNKPQIKPTILKPQIKPVNNKPQIKPRILKPLITSKIKPVNVKPHIKPKTNPVMPQKKPKINPVKLQIRPQNVKPQIKLVKPQIKPGMKASEIAAVLNMRPHHIGGFYSETFRYPSITLSKSQLQSHNKVDRPISIAFYFLLPSGSVSHLHRIPCAVTWHFYMGEPLTVFELGKDGKIKLTVLGVDLEAGQHTQYTVLPNVWFGSFPKGDVISYSIIGNLLNKAPARDSEHHYSLVRCTCAPAFQFQDFELAFRANVLAFAPHARPFISFLTFAN